MHKTYIAYYFPHSSCRSESSFHSFKEGPGIDKGHASLHSMLCNFELELLHDQVGLAQWMRCSEPLGSAAGLQRLKASPSCSLDKSKPSLTRCRRFGSTAPPLLFGATGSLLWTGKVFEKPKEWEDLRRGGGLRRKATDRRFNGLRAVGTCVSCVCGSSPV